MDSDAYRPADKAVNLAAEQGHPADKETEGKGITVPPPDPQAQIESLKAELQQWQDRFLRKAAEFENYRKRIDKERQESAQLAKSSILMEFLPIADACDRALKKMNEPQKAEENLEHYREGVLLLYKQIHDVFSRIGVVPVVAEGQKFDPHFHEAVAREEDAKREENTIIGEFRRGYLFKGRLLRPAQVRVAVQPQPKVEAEH